MNKPHGEKKEKIEEKVNSDTEIVTMIKDEHHERVNISISEA